LETTSIPIDLLGNQQVKTGKFHPILMQWADGKLWERFRKAGGMKEQVIDHPEYGKVMVFGKTQEAMILARATRLNMTSLPWCDNAYSPLPRATKTSTSLSKGSVLTKESS
jgi:hypothetical protein